MTEAWVTDLAKQWSRTVQASSPAAVVQKPAGRAQQPAAIKPKPAARPPAAARANGGRLVARYRQWIAEYTRSADYDFLPATLEILERPPSPLTAAVLKLICGLTVAALIWSWFGHVDVLAVGTGRVQPVGGATLVQSADPGIVIRILATNGQSVRAGQALVELAPQVPQADLQQAETMANSYAAEVIRRRIELNIVNQTVQTFRRRSGVGSGQEPVNGLGASSVLAKIVAQADAVERWPADADSNGQQRSAMAADMAHLRSQLLEYEARIAAKRTEFSDISQAIKSQQQAVDTMRSRVDMRTKMFDASVGSRADVLDATESLQQQQSLLGQYSLQLNQSRKDADSIQTEMFSALDAFTADDADKLNEAERQAGSYQQLVAKAAASLDHATLRSPVDGVVESLTVKSAGQVVAAGEQLMEIVPSRAPLEIRGWIPNSEIGFVHVGQRAIVKLDAYPFTQYGLLEGVVEHVARDSVTDPANGVPNGNPTSGQELARSQGVSYFPVTVRLTQAAPPGDGTPVVPSSGMSVSVEIKTGSRRLISYLLSPLSRAASESFKER